MLGARLTALRHIIGMVPTTPRFIIRLPAELRAELEKIAQAEKRTLSNLILYIIGEWLAGRGRHS